MNGGNSPARAIVAALLIASAAAAAPGAEGVDATGCDGAAALRADDVIVYTAHQGFLSRIYVLRPDGSVIRFFEYDFYYFADLEVVDGEVYAAEAFAPRVYRIDIETGALDVVVDDWSLFYLYDVAFDGTHLYATEWDLNRYDVSGSWAGTASFDVAVMGGAWTRADYWTLDDENRVRCWDLSGWPDVTEIPENAFAPPSPACRGLWHDGVYFWTAENVEGALGWIYCFDDQGTVVQQVLEPAFRGWAACVLSTAVTGDLNGDGSVNVFDLLLLLAAWGPCPGPPQCPADLDGNGTVNALDLLMLLANWG